MLTDRDTACHMPANVAHDRAETRYVYFYVPEARVMASVYCTPGRAAMP